MVTIIENYSVKPSGGPAAVAERGRAQPSAPLSLSFSISSLSAAFSAAQVWNENIILCMSMSKLGLPGVRTGICIARPSIIKVRRVLE
jgi:DNA-binding transcriptional MocR family regulator